MAASKPLKDITDKLEEQLECSICLKVFTKPKTLPCLHSFCAKCIAQWFQARGNPFNNEMECPMCKTKVVVPDGDPSKLPPSFYFDSLLHLLPAFKTEAANQPEFPRCVKCEKIQVLVAFCAQCNGMICEACFNAHKIFKELQDEHQPLMLDQFKEENVNTFIKTQMLCKFHDKRKLEYYCQKCAVCICQKCATLDHPNHKMQSLEDAAQDSRKLIEGAMTQVEKRKENDGQELGRSTKNMDRIQREVEVAEKDVDNAVKMICGMAKEHGRLMKNDLKQTLQELKTADDEEQAAIKTRLEEADDFVQHCQALLERDVAYEEIESKQMLLERGEMLSQAPFYLRFQTIDRNIAIRYCMTEKVMQWLQDIGRIVKNVSEPTQSTIQVVKTPLGFINACKIITRNTEGQVFSPRIESIDVRIKDMEGREVEKKVISQEKPGKYSVRFKPHKRAPHIIHMKIGGETINQSPQKVDILDVYDLFKPVATFGGEGSGRGQFQIPQSIAVSDNGEIAVADEDNHRIQIFSLDGKYKRQFGRQGTGEGQLCHPCDVGFNEDRIIVSDIPQGECRIQEFKLNGAYVRSIYKPEQRFKSLGICVGDDKNIAVCCEGNQNLGIKPRIKVFSKHGNLTHEFHMPCNDEQPFNITYGSGKYFVSYYENNYVRVFDVNGVFLLKFGEKGKRDSQFNGVTGLAAYGPDMILVCDGGNHRVQLFTQDGLFIRSFGSYGSGVGQMDNPTDVAVAADGRVFVTEYNGNRVSVWC